MGTVFAVAIITLIVFLLVRGATRNKNTADSKLRIFEHPSTFEKPDIEMVSKTETKNETTTPASGFGEHQ